jgi:fucose permease
MSPPDSPNTSDSAKALTFAAYASFVPIGVATVLLGPMLPILSARWSLNYSQAGALINVQYVASTGGRCLVGRAGWRAGDFDSRSRLGFC